MRPTVIDIAFEAGVSLATVDRVLNERSGVREKTILAVTDAISKLGYVRVLAAENLARQRNYRRFPGQGHQKVAVVAMPHRGPRRLVCAPNTLPSGRANRPPCAGWNAWAIKRACTSYAMVTT